MGQIENERNGSRKIRIGDLGDVITGKTPRTGNKHNFDGPYPFITIPDMGKATFISQTARTLSETGARSVKSSRLPSGAVLMSCIATIGKCGITTKPSFTNQQINSVVPNEKVDVRFLYYTFTRLGRELDAAGGGGSVYTNISKSRFSNIEVSLPPLSEQKQIADILGSLDDKIELLRRQNKILENTAKAIFKSWFVDFEPTKAKSLARQAGLSKQQAERAAMAVIAGVCSPDQYAKNVKAMDKKLTAKLAVMTPDEQKHLIHTAGLFPDALTDSELDPIPKGWVLKPLDHIADYLNGLACQKHPPKNDTDKLPVLKIKQLKNGIDNSCDWVTSDVDKKYIIHVGDVIFSWSGSLVVTIWSGADCVLNQHLFKVTSKKYPRWFYYFWTMQHMNKFVAIADGKATTMGHIKRGDLQAAKVTVPDQVKIIEAADKIIAPFLDSTILNFKKTNALESSKKILLPRLISSNVL